MPTEINENAAVTEVKTLVEKLILKTLKTMRIISNEMSISLLIPYWWYFDDKSLILTLMSLKCFFKSLCPSETQVR